MKLFAVALIALVASVAGLPPVADREIDTPTDPRFVGDLIASILESVSEDLKENGRDPWNLNTFTFGYELPVPTLFAGSVLIDNVVVTGLSDIVINNIDYGLLSNRLTLDITLPDITIAIGDAGFDFTILGGKFVGHTNSRVSILGPRISGVVQLNVGIITGIFVRDMNLEFELGGISYEGNTNLFNSDITSYVKEVLTNVIPNSLKELREDVNKLVEIIAWEVIETILN